MTRMMYRQTHDFSVIYLFPLYFSLEKEQKKKKNCDTTRVSLTNHLTVHDPRRGAGIRHTRPAWTRGPGRGYK